MAATGSVARGNDPTCPPPPTTSAQPPPTTSALATPGDGATSVDLLPSGHSAAIRLTPNGNYLLVLEIPPRSVLSSAPPSGGVKGADLIDDEPDGVEEAKTMSSSLLSQSPARAGRSELQWRLRASSSQSCSGIHSGAYPLDMNCGCSLASRRPPSRPTDRATTRQSAARRRASGEDCSICSRNSRDPGAADRPCGQWQPAVATSKHNY
jgi:hypothetical protein